MAHTWLAPPMEMDLKGWSVPTCSQELPCETKHAGVGRSEKKKANLTLDVMTWRHYLAEISPAALTVRLSWFRSK